MTIRLELLRTFVAVARAGELAQAANVLGRTPSAISMALKQLQETLDVELFETDRKTRLTKVGHIIFVEAERAVASFDHSVATIIQNARSEIGFIRVAAVPSIAATLLPRAIKAFSQQVPGVRIDLRDMDSHSVQQELLAERIDVGIASSEGQLRGITASLLLEDVFEVLLPERHPLAKSKDLSLDDLAGLAFITSGLCEAIDHPKVQTLVRNSSLSVRNTTSLLSMVREDLGITLLPRMVANHATGIAIVPLKGAQLLRRVHILTRYQSDPAPSISQFLDVLRAEASAIDRKSRN